MIPTDFHIFQRGWNQPAYKWKASMGTWSTSRWFSIAISKPEGNNQLISYDYPNIINIKHYKTILKPYYNHIIPWLSPFPGFP